jgi:hypothetical protein
MQQKEQQAKVKAEVGIYVDTCVDIIYVCCGWYEGDPRYIDS